MGNFIRKCDTCLNSAWGKKNAFGSSKWQKSANKNDCRKQRSVRHRERWSECVNLFHRDRTIPRPFNLGIEKLSTRSPSAMGTKFGDSKTWGLLNKRLTYTHTHMQEVDCSRLGEGNEGGQLLIWTREVQWERPTFRAGKMTIYDKDIVACEGGGQFP